MRSMNYDRTDFENALVYANRMLHRYDINESLIVKKLDYPRHLKMGGSLNLNKIDKHHGKPDSNFIFPS